MNINECLSIARNAFEDIPGVKIEDSNGAAFVVIHEGRVYMIRVYEQIEITMTNRSFNPQPKPEKGKKK